MQGQKPTTSLICNKCGGIKFYWPSEIKKADPQKYICNECKHIPKETVNCKWSKCGKEFIRLSKHPNGKLQEFCSRSCSGYYNNQDREPMSEDQKVKIAQGLLRTWNNKTPEEINQYKLKCKLKCKSLHPPKEFTPISIKTCTGCGQLFIASCAKKNYEHKTCGKPICRSLASVGNRTYPNGRRKLFKYFNKHQNKEVLLESSWELDLAKFLDEQQVIWLRPKPLEWFDNTTKRRHYYPDFYLPEYDIYLDPKNPWGMVNDEEKLSYFHSRIHLMAGNIDILKQDLLGIFKSPKLIISNESVVRCQ